MVRLGALVLILALFIPPYPHAEAATADDVLRGIPAIAKVFAPVGGVDWRQFAQVLAGICAVESTCNPNYPHYTSSGAYSQYQGLFQMNMHQVALSEQQLTQMLPQIRQLVASGQIPQEAFRFVELAIRQGEQVRSTTGDRRFLPAYGIVLGAIKHVQLNKQLAERYPNPVHQAAGHMTAQFSGITEGKIRNRQFTSLIGGAVNAVETEAWALGINIRQNGQPTNLAGVTVHDAIMQASNVYAARMQQMMTRMRNVTGDMSLVPPDVPPFTPPSYQPGSGPLLGVPYSGASTLMEAGLIARTLAPTSPPVSPTLPQSVSNALNSSTSATQPSSTQPGTRLSAMRAIVQPQVAKPGQTVLVSWTSAGMQVNSCSIRIKNEAEIAHTSEGSQSVAVPANAKAGHITFEFTCTPPGEGAIVTEAVIEVRP
jgi:hypothetical protein